MINHLKIQDIKFIEKQISPIIESNFIYIFDSKYEVPKVSILILLKYKELYKKLLIYSKYFKLKEEMFYMEYDTLLSSCMIEININEAGIEINIHGISTKIKYIFDLFIDFLFVNLETNIDKLIIDQIKKKLTKEKFNESYKRLFQGLKSIVIDDYKMSEDLLDSFNFDEEINIKNCEYKLLILGNLLQEEAKEIKNNLSNKLENNEEIIYSNKLYKQDKILSVQSFDIKNNACGLFFYTNTLDDLYKKYVSAFIVNTFQEMFFDQLRTNEEFGYVVCSSTYSVLDKEFMYFVVQSDRDVGIIRERIFKFIEFAKEYIKNLSEEEFIERKECLIDEYNETYKNINSYSYHLYSKYIYNIDGLNLKKIY